MTDSENTRPTSTYKPAVDDENIVKPKKTHAQLNEAGVPVSLWDPPTSTQGQARPASTWHQYPKPLPEAPLPHSDSKPGDLFRHIEVEVTIPEGPLGGDKKTTDKDNKSKIPMW